MAGFFIEQVNKMIVNTIKKLSYFEKPTSKTDFNVSFAFKLSVARFANSSLLLYFTSGNATLWFEDEGLVATVSVLMMTMAVDPILILAQNYFRVDA